MDGFKITTGEFCGIYAQLIVPEMMGTDWTSENLKYRSRIEDLEGNCLSTGHKKFFNYTEKPNLYPDSLEFNDWVIEEKLDGSLAIFDFVNGQFSCRTRGTFSAATQPNANDFEQIYTLYPQFVEFVKKNYNFSFLCEIVTPNNKIVIKYPKVDFYLIGAINKGNLQYTDKRVLDEIAIRTGILRPKIYNFEDIPSLCSAVKQFKGVEGVVLSYNSFQNRIKIKGLEYLAHHKFLSSLSSKNNLIDLFFQLEKPSYENFYSYIEKTFDFEIAETVKETLQTICNNYLDISEQISLIRKFVSDLPISNRKDAAENIKYRYEETHRSIAFMLLDGREIEDPIIKKLLTVK